MRIVHYYPGALKRDRGTPIAVRGWCAAQSATGARVLLLDDSRQPTETDVPEGVEYAQVPHRLAGRLRRPVGLDQFLRGADILVVHGGWRGENLISARTATMLGLPYLVTPHGVYNPQVLQRGRPLLKRAWWTAFEKNFLSRSLAVHVFFPDETSHLRTLGSNAPTVIAPTGFTAPPDIGWEGQTSNYLLWLGRYDIYNKGLDQLLHALNLMPGTQRPQLRLHGPDHRGGRAQLAQIVRALGLEQWVNIEGPIRGASKWRLLAGARGFVYPSRWEAFGMAPAEAVSIGVPTLVTPYPLGKLLGSEGGAVLVENDAQDIATGVERLLSPNAALIASRGQRTLATKLSWETVARSWFEQINRLMAS